MTDPEFADRTYIEPLTADDVLHIYREIPRDPSHLFMRFRNLIKEEVTR